MAESVFSRQNSGSFDDLFQPLLSSSESQAPTPVSPDIFENGKPIGVSQSHRRGPSFLEGEEVDELWDHDTSLISAIYDWNPSEHEIIYCNRSRAYTLISGQAEFECVKKVSRVYRFFRMLLWGITAIFGAKKPSFYESKNASLECVYNEIKGLSEKDIQSYLLACKEKNEKCSEESIMNRLHSQLTGLNVKMMKKNNEFDLFQTTFGRYVSDYKNSHRRLDIDFS